MLKSLEFAISPRILSNGKSEFRAEDTEVFDKNDIVKAYKKKISDLKQMLGKKEIKNT